MPLAAAGKISLARRSFEAIDLADVWLVVAAAPPEVNRTVAAAAESQRLFVLAVDDHIGRERVRRGDAYGAAA